jgi:phage shock protein C
MNNKLYKDKQNAMLFGVCAGISNYIGLDVSLVRILTIISIFFSFSLVFWIYLLLAILLPQKPLN